MPSQPICGRSDPMPRYLPSGSGRDLYMSHDTSHGPVPATGKSSFSEKPPATGVGAFGRSRTDTMPKYFSDGSGRDLYLCTTMTKIPSTGKSKFSERPPSQSSRSQHVRTDPLPPYQPSGSGRDTFHRIDGNLSPSAWSLRSYEQRTESGFNAGFSSGGAFSPPRAQSPDAVRMQGRESRKQLGLMSRLASPKPRTAPGGNHVGLIVPGSYLRK